MGTLAASLPPVDREREQSIAKRRVEAASDLFHTHTAFTEDAEFMALQWAEKRHAEFESWRRMGQKREQEVKLARTLLTSGGADVSPIRQQECLRMCAQDCMYAEEMLKRRLAAADAYKMAYERQEATKLAQEEERRMRAAKEEQEEARLQRKFELDEARLSRMVSTGEQRDKERKELERVRRSAEVALQREVDARLKKKDLNDKRLDGLRRKQAAALKTAQAAARSEKMHRAEEKTADMAAEHARKLELVWNKAQSELRRCEREFEEGSTRLALLPPSPRSSVVGGHQDAGTTPRQLDRLAGCLQRARKREENARQALELYSAKSPRADGGRKAGKAGAE